MILPEVVRIFPARMGKAGRLGPEVRILMAHCWPIEFSSDPQPSGQLRTAKTYNQFQVWCKLSWRFSNSQKGPHATSPCSGSGGSPCLGYVDLSPLEMVIFLWARWSSLPVRKDLRNVEITNAADQRDLMFGGRSLTPGPRNCRSWQFVHFCSPSLGVQWGTE